MEMQIVSDLYTVAIFFFKLLLLKIRVILRSVSSGQQIKTPQIHHTLIRFIEEKYPATLYSSSSSEKKTEECAVCLSEFGEGERVRRLSCKHMFHKDCVDKWLTRRRTEGHLGFSSCPLCRSELVVLSAGDCGSSEWGHQQLLVLLAAFRPDEPAVLPRSTEMTTRH
ncbi:E3 ubiquitin-protein ligase RHA2B [Linum grandiflorum]